VFVKKRLTHYRTRDNLELNPMGGFGMITTMIALSILTALIVSSLIVAGGGTGITGL
jgi:hypothetical protein